MITLTRYKCRILLVVFCLVCVVESVAYGCGGGGGGFSCPGPCWKWVNGICVSVCSCCGGSCCGGRCCDQKVCYDYHTQNCCWDGSGKTCPIGKECCSGTCCDPKQCKVCDANGHCISRCNASQCKECDGNGNCVSRCNSAECKGCVDGECKVCGGDPTLYCENGRCVECRMNFDCDECEECVNGSCVAKTCPPYQYCLLDGSGGCCCGSEVCSWEMPSIESMCPPSGVPDDPYCGAGTVGAVCWWEIKEVRNTTTHIGECGKTDAGPCVILEPRLCRDECTPGYPFFCICSETFRGATIPRGHSERCPGW